MQKNVEPEKKVKSPEKKVKKRTKKEKLIRVGIVLLLSIAAVGLLIWGLYHLAVEYYLGKINIESNETGLIFETELIEDTVTLEETIDIDEILTEENTFPAIVNENGVANILILATDERFKNEATRTDTMILLSINEAKKKIVLCSLMRDIYVQYPSGISTVAAGKWGKLNNAHAYGGAALTMATLKENFNIEVNYYVKVNFYDFAKIIDAMGGLDVPLSSAEVDTINKFASLNDEENRRLGTTKDDLMVNKGDGTYHLNGIQAVHHARNRDIGSDWQRTNRQRQILELILTKFGRLPVTQVMSFFNEVLPMITTNMSKDLLKGMVGNVLSYAKYDRVSTRIPQAGLYHEEQYNIIVYPENLFRLYEEIYGIRAEGDPRDAVQETAPQN